MEHASSSVGFDNMPPKLIPSEIINETLIEKAILPSSEKVVFVMLVFRKVDRLKKEVYRPISVLNVFSKVFEHFILNQMIPYLNDMLSVFLSAYRQNYSCQHILLRLIEMWCKFLDDNKSWGSILIDLSKAFDSLPHDLLIEKWKAYGFDKLCLDAYCIIPN